MSDSSSSVFFMKMFGLVLPPGGRLLWSRWSRASSGRCAGRHNIQSITDNSNGFCDKGPRCLPSLDEFVQKVTALVLSPRAIPSSMVRHQSSLPELPSSSPDEDVHHCSHWKLLQGCFPSLFPGLVWSQTSGHETSCHLNKNYF